MSYKSINCCRSTTQQEVTSPQTAGNESPVSSMQSGTHGTLAISLIRLQQKHDNSVFFIKTSQWQVAAATSQTL